METNLALMIGNSRFHWGLLTRQNLKTTWDTDYLTPDFVHQLLQLTTLEGLLSHILPFGFPKDLSHWASIAH